MKIQTKLISGFLIVSTLTVLLGYLSFLELKEISSPLHQNIPVSIDHLIHANEIAALAQDLRYYREILMQSARNYALTRQNRWNQRYYASEPELANAIVKIINKADEIQKERLQEIDETNKTITAIERAAIRYVDEGQHLRAVELLENEDYWTQKRLYERKIQNYFLEHGTSGTPGITVKLAAQHAQEVLANSITMITVIVLVTLVLSIMTGVFITRSIAGPLKYLTDYAKRISEGDLSPQITIASDDEIGMFAKIFNEMRKSLSSTLAKLENEKANLDSKVKERTVELQRRNVEIEVQNRLKNDQTKLLDQMRGDLPTDVLCQNIITELCKRLEFQTGLMYLPDGDGILRLVATYAHKHKKHLATEYKPGEGLVGQAALEKEAIILADVPQDYITIESGLGEAVPRHICVKPIVHNDKVIAVIELGTLHAFTESQSLFLNMVMESIAMAVKSSESKIQLTESLEESQQFSEELQAQQEELKAANEGLEEQTLLLQDSEEKLKAQQEELQVSNEELEEKNDLLERQTKEVEHARKDIETKAEELVLANKYKSEFLANMTHELRTPLNSLLILAQGLEQNKEGNLTTEQVESAGIIHGGGIDLLNLINEILDLAKIEAGRMDLQTGTVRVSDLADGIRTSFQHMAGEKSLGLDVVVREDAPGEIVNDRKRVKQIVRNFISNALKFTEKGSVTVTFGQLSFVNGHWEDSEGKIVVLRTAADQSEISNRKSQIANPQILAIAVKDTGIGIAPEQQEIVFEAFQQADAGTARKYGGTGLGLSISRELARLLGGEIQLESELDQGSTFTLYLPVAMSADRKAPAEYGVAVSRQEEDTAATAARQRASAARIEDDRSSLEKDDRVILVIEDDPNFAGLLYRKCHEKGFKCLAATTGEAGLELAAKHLPAAVILDIRLPGMDGWVVLSALKESTRTRHIPVHIISVAEASTEALRKGAVGHAVKPLNQEDLEETFRRLERMSAGKQRRVLVVEDDAKIRRETVQLIEDGDVKVDEAENGEQALQALHSGRYDCVVLDLGLPDISGGELLARLDREGVQLPPVIIHTARDLTREEEMDLCEHAESIVIKDVRSPERLLDEVSLFLHRMVGNMPEKKKQMILNLHETDVLFKDKKVLVVDDDMRTAFAMSNLLAGRGMQTLKAENGERALGLLAQEPDVDLVLMDIMMPVMDGYETMQRIRAQDRFKKLPIIALTAKAMPEDRTKCIDAGASDYLPKPLDEDRLISMMRVWLYK